MNIRDMISPDNLGRSIDTLVGILSPEAAVKRQRLRMAADQIRLFEGATKGRRGDAFRRVKDDSPKAGLAELGILRLRARDLSRNNGYAMKAVNAIASNTIGTGIVLQIKTKRKNGKAQIADAWKKWSESTACDFYGQSTFAGLQELATKVIVESGEVFIRRTTEDSRYVARTGQVPLKLQLLEPEYLDQTKDSFAGEKGNQVVGGVEFNPYGQRVAYHIFKSHPSSGISVESVRVKAEDILHVYRLDRIGQLRGIPWAAPIVLTMSDLDTYEDAELMRRRVAACFAGFISSDLDDASGAEEEVPLVDRLAPGILEKLRPGEQITFATPPSVTGYAEYATSVLHKIAAGYQVPYSVLTGDFTQVNFSSGRMGWLEFQRLIEQWRWNMIIPRFLNPVWEWFSDAASVAGLNSEAVSVEWTAPRREMIDPLKEIEAIERAVKAGLMSMPEAIRELGYDPDTNIEEIKEWNTKLDAASIVLDSDPRKDPKRLTAEKVASTPKVG